MTVPLLRRARLIDSLCRPGSRIVTVVDAPAGYGKTVLLDQAGEVLAQRPGHCVVRHACRPGEPLFGAAEPAAALAELAARTGVQRLVAIVDDAHLAGPGGLEEVGGLADRLPQGSHLLVAGRSVVDGSLARHAAATRNLVVGAEDLALTMGEIEQLAGGGAEWLLQDPDLVAWPVMAGFVLRRTPALADAYVREEVLAPLPPDTRAALAVLSSVEGAPDEVLPALLAGAEGVAELKALPLVDGDGGVWPHPAWARWAADDLDEAGRTALIDGRVAALLAEGRLADAGALSVRHHRVPALEGVVRVALGGIPARVPSAVLDEWSRSGVLAESPVRHWLDGVVALSDGSRERDRTGGRDRLEQARAGFADRGDDDGEVGVILHQGLDARRRSDLAELQRLLDRAVVLAGRGGRAAAGLVALGRAVTAQVANDHAAAIDAIDSAPAGALQGDWAAQSKMIRGTNLMQGGDPAAGADSLFLATGEGSPAIRAVAHDLLATAEWFAGRTGAALADADEAVRLSTRWSAPGYAAAVAAHRNCLLAASGRTVTAAEVTTRDDEAEALGRIARALVAAAAGDLDAASQSVAGVVRVDRPLRATLWTVSLGTALGLANGVVDGGLGANPTVARALEAGRAAARHLAGGGLVDSRHRAFLPSAWCEPVTAEMTLRLLGPGEVLVDGETLAHPAWSRSRVRELCLYLSVAGGSSRGRVAAQMWPELTDEAAGRNLRVTLTHLSSLLNRGGAGRADASRLLLVDGGTLSLSPSLEVDIARLASDATIVLATADHDRQGLLAHARRMLVASPEPALSGMRLGEWFEPHRRRLADLTERALLRAGDAALAAADAELATRLAERVLASDEWSERAHLLRITSRLQADDHDGARSALRQALGAFRRLGIRPGPAFRGLATRAGLIGSDRPQRTHYHTG